MLRTHVCSDFAESVRAVTKAILHVDMLHRFTADLRKKDMHSVETIEKLVLESTVPRFPNKGHKDVQDRLNRFLKYCRKLRKTKEKTLAEQFVVSNDSELHQFDDEIDIQMADDEDVPDVQDYQISEEQIEDLF